MMVSASSLPSARTFFWGSSNMNLHNNISQSIKKNNYKATKQPHRGSCKAQLIAELAPATSAVYGALLLGGGFFAYKRSGSKGSLIGGVSGGALMATAYFLMQSPETKSIGDALGFGSAFLFSSVFVIRLIASRKIIPSGPLLGLSVGAMIVFISAYMQGNV